MDRDNSFRTSKPKGHKPDVDGPNITKKGGVYAAIQKYGADDRFTNFQIDFLKVKTVIDTADKTKEGENAPYNPSKFGMVEGKFIFSEKQKLQTNESKAYPLNVSSFELPLPNEIVPVIRYSGTNYYLDQLTLNGFLPSHNPEIGNTTGWDEDTLKEIQKKVEGYAAPKNPKKRPIVNRGSKQISSRYGSSILMDHTEGNPSIRLSNNQSQGSENIPFLHQNF
jgi:hypothetical protein